MAPRAYTCGIRKGSGMECLRYDEHRFPVSFSTNSAKYIFYIHYIRDSSSSHGHREPSPSKMFDPLLPDNILDERDAFFKRDLALLLDMVQILTLSLPIA